MKGGILMNRDEIKKLNEKAKEIRKLTLEMIAHLGVGHIGGALSIVESAVALYYKIMNTDPENPKWEGRDRFILSKGHAGPAIYAILADKGYFSRDELYTLNKPGTSLPSHMDMNLTPGVDMTTGSLGQGFSAAVGQAMGSRIKKDGVKIYTLIGDGESNEGLIWEAAMCAAHYKLDSIIAFTDYNKLQLDGFTKDIINLDPLKDKWQAFGWHTQEVDGHNIEQICDAVEQAKKVKGKPHMIILHTVKGKGAYFCENQVTSHNMSVTMDMYEKACELLDKSN
jgi:transketolase